MPDRLAPVVTTELNYLAGSNDAPDGFPGTAHALEHMMFRGSDGLDKDQLAELGALLGGHYNADTTETVTQYTYTVPADNLDIALQIEALRMRGLSLNQSDWEKERGAIEQEVSRDLSSPFYNFMSQAQAILFDHTPYEHDALGTRPSFDRTDAALLRRFYETWYAPNNAILVIAGDVRPDEALAQAKAAFGDIPRRDLPPHAPVEPQPVQPKTLTLPTNFSVGLIALAYRMPGLKKCGFRRRRRPVATCWRSERGALYGLVPAGKALLAHFTYQAKPDVGFGLAMVGFPAGDDPAPLLAETRSASSPTIARRRRARRTGGRRQAAGTGAARISGQQHQRAGATLVAGARLRGRRLAGGCRPRLCRRHRRRRQPPRAPVAGPGPCGHRDPDAPRCRQAGRRSGFGGAESFGAPPDHPVTLPAWAAAALATPHLPDPGTAPDVSVLPNGLRLIVQPEHVSHTVSVFGRVRQVPAMQEPPGKEGIASLMRGLFEYGTEAHDRLAFQEAGGRHRRAGQRRARLLPARADPGVRGRHAAAGGKRAASGVPARRVHRRPRPACPEASPARCGRRIIWCARALRRAIVPDGDPSLRQPTPASLMALSPDDLRAYYAATFRPDLTTIVIVGDVTPEQARRVVADTFGDVAGGRSDADIDLPPVDPSKPSSARMPDGNALQDSVTLAETLTLPVTSPDRYTLMLGNVILGSGFSSRLYQDLRIQSGYVYSVGSALDWSRSRADYSVSFGADTANVEKARQLILRDLKDMQTTPVSEAELTRAKAEILRRLPMQRASISGIAGQYLRLTDLGPAAGRRPACGRTLPVDHRAGDPAGVRQMASSGRSGPGGQGTG